MNYVITFEQRPFWSAILDFYISPEAPKTVKIDQKRIKQLNKHYNDSKKCENCKDNGKILIKKASKSNFRKTCLSKCGCLGNVKLLGSRYVIPNCCQINISGKVAKFAGVCFNIYKVINIQSQRGRFLHTPPPPGRIVLKSFNGKFVAIFLVSLHFEKATRYFRQRPPQ